MASITLKGNPVHTNGDLPKTGAAAPDFSLVKTDLSDLTLRSLAGKTVVLNVFPSIDTSTCATSVRTFNAAAAGFDDTVVLCVSKDLPFAQKRFCGAENLDRVVPVSAFRDQAFGKAYGVSIVDGPLAGLFARAVFVIDPKGKLQHAQLVPEIAHEPDYAAVLATLS
jgi:thiol peroxidase